MKELEITKGEWIYDDGYEGAFVYAKTEIGITTIAEMASVNSGDEMLIADAGNTAQKCGLLPSELLKQRDELLKEKDKLIMRLHEAIATIRAIEAVNNAAKADQG